MKLSLHLGLYYSVQKNWGGIWYDYTVGARKANCHPNGASSQFSAVGLRPIRGER